MTSHAGCSSMIPSSRVGGINLGAMEDKAAPAVPLPQPRQRSLERLLRDAKSRHSDHTYATRFSLAVTALTLLLLGALSVAFSADTWGLLPLSWRTPNPGQGKGDVPRRWLDEATTGSTKQRLLQGPGDNSNKNYSSYSCHYIYEEAPDPGQQQCQFARTCNEGDGVWAPFVFCSGHFSPDFLAAMISPVMILWMVLLFRMLASTAEDYFSPALEMFSAKLGLPPRFAGVTLLALGNGAADVSATISAITSDPKQGYKLSLGALTGAAMMISGVISAIVVLTADGVNCRGALVRDVIMLLITVVVVWRELASGDIGVEALSLFISLYCTFVILVLAADVYHRAVVLPREAVVAREMERTRQLEEQRLEEATLQRPPQDGEATSAAAAARSPLHSIMTALSNYDANDPKQQRGWGVESEDLAREQPMLLHGARGVLHGNALNASGGGGSPVHPNSSPSAAAYIILEDTLDRIGVEPGSTGAASGWADAFVGGKAELIEHGSAVWDDIIWNADVDVVSKFLLLCELPFTVLRKITVPVPCQGYYVRALVSLSLTLSPLWLVYYLWHGKGLSVLSSGGWLYWLVFWFCLSVLAMVVLRFAPGGDGSMNIILSAPIAFYGFAVAATWIDTIANALVDVLNFVGIILRIPGPIIGLTILAWGNCMSDLSTNVAMARKGLANMAITACFAGPVFNILIGLSLGFSSLTAKTGQINHPISIPPSVLTGFVFLILNSVLILMTGLVFGKGRVFKSYGYVALLLYVLYIIISVSVQYSRFGDH